MAAKRERISFVRMALVAASYAIPSLCLIVLGSLYLWEHGWLVQFALSMLAITLLLQLASWIDRKRNQPLVPSPALETDHNSSPDTFSSPAERSAWQDVLAVSNSVQVAKLQSWTGLADLGHQTVQTVAARMHPEKADAIWQFTLPEAFSIVEQVSGRLALYTSDRLPLGDKLTVAQILALYRSRHLIDFANRAYSVWRLLRFVNPATAATQEARERLSRAMMSWGRDELLKRLIQTYVEEVGRAAIDLYGGRLSLPQSAKDEASRPNAPSAGEMHRETQPLADPSPKLSIGLAGGAIDLTKLSGALQRAANKDWQETGLDLIGDISTVPLGSGTRSERRSLMRAAVSCDVLIVCAPSGRLSPALLQALSTINDHFAKRSDVLPPVVMGLAFDGQAPTPDDGSGLPFANSASHLAALDPILVTGGAKTIEGHAAAVIGELRRRAPQASRVKLLRERTSRRRSFGLARAGRQAVGTASDLARLFVRRR